MKSTGIIRRIDELGRIVIPKEIRKNLRIHNGDNLEINVESEKIILEKNIEFNKIKEIIDPIVYVLYKNLLNVIVCDSEKIIYSKIDIKNKYISKELEKILLDRKIVSNNNKIKITIDTEIDADYYILPLISDSQAIGLMLIYKNKPFNESDNMLINFVNIFLKKYLDE